jgi:hypothetical protein
VKSGDELTSPRLEVNWTLVSFYVNAFSRFPDLQNAMIAEVKDFSVHLAHYSFFVKKLNKAETKALTFIQPRVT